MIRDPNSVANILSFTTKHIKLAWKIDFQTSKIVGSATLTLARTCGSREKKVRLDCSNLNVKSVRNVTSGIDLCHVFDPTATKFGGLLEFELDEDSNIPEERESYNIEIKYETTEKSSALQWLKAEQTAGKKFPYLFSQCQAIHARTMLPCQDTPAVKATFSATVSVVSPLSVVMSANKMKSETLADENVFHFEQTQPIPAYLIAIGAGNITCKDIGPRSKVWSEPEVLDAAAYEFAETESFIKTAEDLVGPYVWERYDILLLPPSFPYGGMENPCLTFLTPSLLCGDRSLVDVVAHEISHSWTGNLVSCMNWEHFWLNEGFTMFLERKILANLHGEGWRQFNSLIGLAELNESVTQFKGDGPETRLVQHLSDTDPDDVFSTVPYEKGYTLLYTLEELVGGPSVFEPFFKAHIQKFAGLSIVSEDFKQFIFEYYSPNREITQKLKEFDWNSWFNGTGMPPTIPKYSNELMHPCEELATAWLAEPATLKRIDDGKNINHAKFYTLSPAQKVMFIDILLRNVGQITKDMVKKLDDEYQLSNFNNVEVLLKWYLLGIRTKSEFTYNSAANFATQHGRMKYCRPILRELFKSGTEGRELALKTFHNNRQFYHPIAAQMISKDLHLV